MEIEKQVENGRAIGSVKAAISMYGGNFSSQGTNPIRKTQNTITDSEKRNSKASELHLAKNRIDRLNGEAKMAESEKSQAELQLMKARKVVRELTAQIQVSKSKANEHSKVKSVGVEEDDEYDQVTRQVEALKGELSKLKFDMAHALEEKSRAEKEAEAASLRLENDMRNAKQLSREIEDANEEEVLVELAQIQARKELAEIEAMRKEERDKFSAQIEETRKKVYVLREEIEKIKDLEERLAESKADIQVLQNELSLIREMDRRVERKNTGIQIVNPQQLEDMKKELESINAGAFQLMRGMDVSRNELKETMEEKERMQKKDEVTEISMMNLNSELLRARDKLEAASTSEGKERFMLKNLSVTHENLQKEKELALKEKESSQEEIVRIRTEIEKIETETDAKEERLSTTMQELTAAKSAEAKAMKKLKTTAEKAAKTRASMAKKKPTISISTFEYKYLRGCAVAAQELAEKKAAAAHAWAEALSASEREMNMKIEQAKREIEQLIIEEDEEYEKMERSLNALELVEGELEIQGKQANRRSIQGRKSIRENRYSLTPVKRTKIKRLSAGFPTSRRVSASGSGSVSGSFTMKRRTRVMLRIGKYFAGKQPVNEKGVSVENRV